MVSYKELLQRIPGVHIFGQNASSKTCPICGGLGVRQHKILWSELIEAWGLTQEEVELINRQQSECCIRCGSNLRSRTLAGALNDCFNWTGSLKELTEQIDTSKIHLLEINEAGSLTTYLSKFEHYELLAYPQIDIQKMDIESETYDFVIHSDTLEHIPNPILGLRECRRILRPRGHMLMTIPIVPTRLTRRRDNMNPSYHGNPTEKKDDLLVWSEYGADFYADLIEAGWNKITLYTLGTLDSLAIIASK